MWEKWRNDDTGEIAYCLECGRGNLLNNAQSDSAPLEFKEHSPLRLTGGRNESFESQGVNSEHQGNDLQSSMSEEDN